jgi:hypothetical protein
MEGNRAQGKAALRDCSVTPRPAVGARCLTGGIASQSECTQPRSLFPHRAQFGLVVGCLLALTQLLFFLKQSFGATVCLIQIRTQYRNSWAKPNRRSPASRPKPPVFGLIKKGPWPGAVLSPTEISK